MVRLFSVVLILAGISWAGARAEVYQYAVPAMAVDGREITAFLWVPPEADRVRGVLVGGMTLMEPGFAEDPLIRQACAAERLAIVYFFPSLDALFDYSRKSSASLLQKALDDLSEASGYREVGRAPLFPFGHSVSTIFASHVVCWNPGRCFGALLFKGGIRAAPDEPDATLTGVPILVIKGQFEEFGPGPNGVLRDFEDRETSWKGMSSLVLGLRERDDRHLLAYLVEPGASHFAWSDRLAPYTSLFIRKAAQRRIPDWPADTKQPVKCRQIDPATGALTSSNLGRESIAAAYQDYPGDRRKAFWHLDLELARSSDALHAGMFEKKPQFVTFADAKTGRPILVGHDLRLRLAVSWNGPDTFEVAGTFLDKAPDKYPKVQGPVGHADGPIRFRVFAGTVEPIGPETFRVRLDGRQGVRADILAFHPGDADYRYAEQQGRVSLPERLNQGKVQTITFPPVSPLKPDSLPVKLRAVSDSGLPVRYYVQSGPAVIEGDSLRLAEVPRRACFPLRITVVAYQYGSAVVPFVQTAPPVTQVVLVRN